MRLAAAMTSGCASRFNGALLLLCAAILLPRYADAESPGATAEQQVPETPHADVLAEVVVSATRREEPLSKVPISVIALSQDAMDLKGIRDFQDIVRYTPGVSVDNSGTNAISIRGISSSGGAGTTGIYIDDTPIQMRNVGFNPDDALPKTFDLERVEVLRGPQGTLFGAGSEGGTVRYILTPPATTGSSSYLRSELAYTEGGQPSYELGAAHGDTLVPGALGYRIAAWYRADGGWIDKVDPTTRLPVEHSINRSADLLLRATAAWEATDALVVTPGILLQSLKRHNQATFWPAYSDADHGIFNTATPEQQPVPDTYYLPTVKIQLDLGRTQLLSNTSYYHRNEKTGYQGTVYGLGFFQAVGWPGSPFFSPTPQAGFISGCGALSASRNPPCSWYPLLDANGIHLPPAFAALQTPNTITNTQDSVTQEFRWQSVDQSSRRQWTLGIFGQMAKERSIEELRSTNIDPFFEGLYGVTATSVLGPFYGCNGDGNYSAIPACDIYYNNNTTYDRQLAAFGEFSYALTQRLKLTFGERVAKTSFSLSHFADGLENGGPGSASAREHETPNTPKASLAFQVDPANLLYATYAKGFRVGGGNPPLPVFCDAGLIAAGYSGGAPLAYRSDSTQNFEVGAKNSFEHIKLASSVYYIKWNEIQQNVYIPLCGFQFTDNLGTAVAKGFDIQGEAIWGRLSFDTAIGYTSARYSRDSRQGLAFTGDAISGVAAIDGSPGVTPPWTAALGVEYGFLAFDRSAFVRFDYQYSSRNPWQAAVQDPRSVQYNPNTYTLSATRFAQVRTGVSLGSWSLSLFCDNLFNSHTIINYQLGPVDPYNPGTNFSQPSSVEQNQYTFRPRTIGLSVAYRGQ